MLKQKILAFGLAN